MNHAARHETDGRRDKIQLLVFDIITAAAAGPKGDLRHRTMHMGFNPTHMDVFSLHNRLDMHEADVQRAGRLTIHEKVGNALIHGPSEKSTIDFDILSMEDAAGKSYPLINVKGGSHEHSAAPSASQA